MKHFWLLLLPIALLLASCAAPPTQLGNSAPVPAKFEIPSYVTGDTVYINYSCGHSNIAISVDYPAPASRMVDLNIIEPVCDEPVFSDSYYDFSGVSGTLANLTGANRLSVAVGDEADDSGEWTWLEPVTILPEQSRMMFYANEPGSGTYNGPLADVWESFGESTATLRIDIEYGRGWHLFSYTTDLDGTIHWKFTPLGEFEWGLGDS